MKILRKLFVFVGVLALLIVTLTWVTPANWIADYMNLRQQGVSWSQIKGNLWNGQAQGVEYGDLLLGEIQWDFQTFNRLRPLQTTWRISGKGHDYELDGFVDTRGSEISDLRLVQGSIPAGWVDLSDYAPLLFLSGKFNLALDYVTTTGNKGNLASGTVYWNEAGLTGLVEEPIGTVVLDLKSEKGFTVADIYTERDSEIQIEGQVRLNNRQYFADLTLMTDPDKRYVLEQLAGLGTLDENGVLSIEQEGRLNR